MKKTTIWDDEEFMDWFNERPFAVQKVIRKCPPDKMYKLSGVFPVHIHAYEENKDHTVTLKVIVHSPIFQRMVFGINPEDLTEIEDLQL